MTREENIRAILESNFAGMKDEIIDNAVNRIMELKQEPATKSDLGVDAVSRKAVKEVLYAPKKAILTFEVFEKAIDNLPSVTPQEPRWIPVSERLPEENKTVIASTKYGVYSEARYTKEDGWEWAYESGADYWVELEYVTAWMPLPESYKGEVRNRNDDSILRL